MLKGILSGVGNLSGVFNLAGSARETYGGDYEVTPRAYEAQILETANKVMKEDLTVLEIPFFETGNNADGTTIYIGNSI